MASRFATVVLLALLAILHGQLWFGRGSVPDVTRLRTELDAQKARNAVAKQANEQLEAEVRDLKEGLGMVEEKARLELGMVRQGEIFVQLTQPR